MSKSEAVTPLMRQYYAVKEKHPDKILFFRMGDFYEMFGDDAVKAAPILGVALTTRAHGKAEKIPLAGVPHHAADKYLAKLLAAGEKVVIVEQTEDPKAAKGLVKRDIVEILTPGTATVEGTTEENSSRWLGALYAGDKKQVGMAALDLSTGTFIVDQGEADEIIERLRVLEPSEIIYPSSDDDEEEVLPRKLGIQNGNSRLTSFEPWNFDFRTANRELNEHFGTTTLEGFGISDQKQAVAAAGAVFRYLKENFRDRVSHINRLTRFSQSEYMILDYSTVRNLELLKNNSDATERNSLFSVINNCHTAAGARRLKNSLLRPFKTKERIERRQSGIAELVKNRELAADIRDLTKPMPDLEKLTGRLGIGKLSPRQTAAIGDGLELCRKLSSVLQKANSSHLSEMARTMPDGSDLIEHIRRALTDEPPLVANKGGIIRRGYSAELDQLNDSISGARKYIASLQAVERERTKIPTLKVGFNKVFGYYLEVTKVHAKSVPEDYQRKQTLVNAERYITPELKEKEELILNAEEKIFRLESELFEQLISTLEKKIADLIGSSELAAEIDMTAGLAELAVARGYCRPTIFVDSRLVIKNGRHPVIESVLPPGSFVANDTAIGLENERIHVLTGPNMSGKSTYLRQIGLIAIMAQIGSFVPADSAEIGLVDRVFTRVGALDNLARGQSTFLVEMVETANIMHNATERSLLLLDEVGRGTSTFDGLSIAWAVVEYINERLSARTIFATHYHELTGMAELYPAVRNYQVAVKRWEDRIVFLHQIIHGGCDDSYGIEVARLAGLPKATLGRAKQILRLLESGKFNQSELGRSLYREKMQPSLFDAPVSEIEEKIKKLDLDNMTPMAALTMLREMKDKLDE